MLGVLLFEDHVFRISLEIISQVETHDVPNIELGGQGGGGAHAGLWCCTQVGYVFFWPVHFYLRNNFGPLSEKSNVFCLLSPRCAMTA